MIDINLVRTQPDLVKQSLKNRNADPSIVDQILEADQNRRKAISEAESLRSEQKSFNQEIAKAKKEGRDVAPVLNQLKTLSDRVKLLQEHAEYLDARTREALSSIPNVLHESVPVGADETQNKVVHIYGEIPKFSFTPKDHVTVGENLGILDFERATKIASARFVITRGLAAKLERSLISFFLDHNVENGYEECLTPFMVNSNSLFGTGQLPKFHQDLFHIKDFDLKLIPTAEVPVTNMYAGEILEEDQLPMNFTAYSPCFRSEAGSAGKDTRGMIRVHQFNKVEVVKYAHPDKSYEEHEALRKNSEKLLEKLGLAYRTVALCSGDIGFGAAKCYDLEVWLPSQNAYREISSCSNFEDFQARRANIRFRSKVDKKLRFVHTLNGSALAVGRTLVAILENYQNEDGSVRIPEVLQKYVGAKVITKS